MGYMNLLLELIEATPCYCKKFLHYYVLLGFTSPASQPGSNTLYQKYSGKNAYHTPESAGINQIRAEKVLVRYFKVQKSRFCQIWLL